MPILVLDGHSNAAVETLQSLGRKGLEVDVSTETDECVAVHSRYAKRKLRQPPQKNTEEFHNWLRKQYAERQYELIIPSTETSLLGIRSLDPSDPIRIRAVVSSDESLEIALDKYRTCRLAEKMNVPVPRSELVDSERSVDRPASYPVVLKPLRSKVVVDGQLRIFKAEMVRNEKDYKATVERLLRYTPLVRQEFVYGRGVGAEFLFDHGRKIWHFAHERVHELPLWGGASTYRQSIIAPPALLADAEKMLAALSWHGVAMVEFRMDAIGRHWFMEINPRLWGSLALAIDAGVDFPLGLWQLACGTPPAAQPNYRKGYYTRDLEMDLRWFKDNLRASSKDKLLLTKNRVLSILGLLRPLLGTESWDYFDLHDLGVTRQTLKSIYVDLSQQIFGRSRERNHKPLTHP